jgi:hypothetical protein
MSLLAHSALFALDSAALIKLLLISLAPGIGISAVGSGGVFMTIGLYAFTDLPRLSPPAPPSLRISAPGWSARWPICAAASFASARPAASR